MSTKIEWTDITWNPSTGCDRISPGCDNCYAMTMAKRLKAMGAEKYQNDGDPRTSGPGFGVTFHPEVALEPLRWRKPRKVFVDSMSDLAHARVADEEIALAFAVMALAPQHQFQLLTKRPKRLAKLLARNDFRKMMADVAPLIEDGNGGDSADDWLRVNAPWPLPNVWIGVSAEDQTRAHLRIPWLLDTPAAVRFVSAEPLLGPLDLRMWLEDDPAKFDVPPLDWVIVGGESGPKARPMHPDWARDIRDQCTGAGVAYLFKQWGDYVTTDQMPEDTFRDWDALHNASTCRPGMFWRVGKKHAGRELDGRTWDEYPEVSA